MTEIATRPRVAAIRARPVALWLHRWVGLTVAAFLFIAGITGSVIAYYPPLDALLNPELMLVEPPAPDTPLLDPIELQARIQSQFSEHPLSGVALELRPGRSVNYWINERETFFSPYTGELLGSRRFGDVTEGRKTFLTFLYRLHFSLALDDVGTWLFGVIALLWTFDSLVGAYLTFPVSVPAARGKKRVSWLARWAPAWLLKTSQLFSLVFTWHRASGLWVWGFLMVFAWSAVALNLHDEVYEPVMSTLLPGEHHAEPPGLDPPRTTPALSLRAALARGRELMAEQARERGFSVIGERYIDHSAEHGQYHYVVESTLDIGERLAETTVAFDSNDGRLIDFESPTTEGARVTIDQWLIALHFGAVRALGGWYRAFVCLLGVFVALLSVTGVWIWLRKRGKRAQRRRSEAASSALEGEAAASEA